MIIKSVHHATRKANNPTTPAGTQATLFFKFFSKLTNTHKAYIAY